MEYNDSEINSSEDFSNNKIISIQKLLRNWGYRERDENKVREGEKFFFFFPQHITLLLKSKLKAKQL